VVLIYYFILFFPPVPVTSVFPPDTDFFFLFLFPSRRAVFCWPGARFAARWSVGADVWLPATQYCASDHVLTWPSIRPAGSRICPWGKSSATAPSGWARLERAAKKRPTVREFLGDGCPDDDIPRHLQLASAVRPPAPAEGGFRAWILRPRSKPPPIPVSPPPPPPLRRTPPAPSSRLSSVGWRGSKTVWLVPGVYRHAGETNCRPAAFADGHRASRPRRIVRPRRHSRACAAGFSKQGVLRTRLAALHRMTERQTTRDVDSSPSTSSPTRCSAFVRLRRRPTAAFQTGPAWLPRGITVPLSKI
jgi:hypothetical protein